MIKSKKQRAPFTVANVIFIILFAVLAAYSLYLIFMLLWGFNTSLKSSDDFSFMKNYMGLPNINDPDFGSRNEFLHFANYKKVFKTFRITQSETYYMGSTKVFKTTKTLFGLWVGAKTESDLTYAYFPDMLINTLVYVFGCALVSSFIPALTAYLTAKYNYKVSGVIFVAYTLMMCMPVVGDQPTRLAFFKALGIYDTMGGVILQWASGAGLYFFVFHAYFKGVPETYREAASIDGAGDTTVMFRIYFPLAIKMIMTVFLLQFVTLWNDYQTPLLLLPTKPTLAYGVYFFSSLSLDHASYNEPLRIAASMMLALPILIIFIVFKNKLMGDISLGGIKE